MHLSILETIGNTPLVQLNRINPHIYAKVESRNPGGSIKDRIALEMVEEAERRKLIKPGDTLVEPTSGNTGVGLAMVCAVKGYKLALTMPESMSSERRKLLSAYGAELVLTPADKGMGGAVAEAARLAREKGHFQLGQFDNPANPAAHAKTTAQEILRELKKIDFFVAGVGTGGTLTGVGEILKRKMPRIKVLAVEPDSSAVLSGEKPGSHAIQGIGAGFVPKVLKRGVCDSVIRVKDEDAFSAARMLARKEGILAGISSGANLHASLLVAKDNPGKTIVTILPDTGERYLSTKLFG